MSKVTISLTPIKVDRQGYTREGYYGAGQNGHEYRVTFEHGCSARSYTGFVRGSDGRKICKAALAIARAGLVNHGLSGVPVEVVLLPGAFGSNSPTPSVSQTPTAPTSTRPPSAVTRCQSATSRTRRFTSSGSATASPSSPSCPRRRLGHRVDHHPAERVMMVSVQDRLGLHQLRVFVRIEFRHCRFRQGFPTSHTFPGFRVNGQMVPRQTGEGGPRAVRPPNVRCVTPQDIRGVR